MADIFTNAPSTLDFEENDLTDFDGTSASGTGSIASSGVQKHAGSYSCLAQVSSAGAGVALGRKEVSWPAGDVAYARTFMYVSSLGSGEVSGLAEAVFGFHKATFPNLNTNTASCLLCINPANLKFDVYYIDSTGCVLWQNVADVTTGQFLEVELCYDFSGTNTVVNLWIDGTNYNTTGTGKPAADPQRVIAGACTNIENGDKVIYHDDIQCEDARIGGVADLEGNVSDNINVTDSISGQVSSLLAEVIG